MNTHFPLATATAREAEKIIHAMDARQEELKESIASQNLLKTITVVALKNLGLAAGILAIACLPVSILAFTITPLTIAAGSLAVAIACLALGMLLDPHSPGESIVKDHWNALFAALRKGNGLRIVEASHDLAKQEKKRASAYKSCIGTLTRDEITPFLHKTCVIGYLLIAIEHLSKSEIDKAQANAKVAMSYVERSNFPEEVSQFAQAVCNYPVEMQQLLEIQSVGIGVHAIDCLIHFKRKMPQLENKG